MSSSVSRLGVLHARQLAAVLLKLHRLALEFLQLRLDDRLPVLLFRGSPSPATAKRRGPASHMGWNWALIRPVAGQGPSSPSFRDVE